MQTNWTNTKMLGFHVRLLCSNRKRVAAESASCHFLARESNGAVRSGTSIKNAILDLVRNPSARPGAVPQSPGPSRISSTHAGGQEHANSKRTPSKYKERTLDSEVQNERIHIYWSAKFGLHEFQLLQDTADCSRNIWLTWLSILYTSIAMKAHTCPAKASTKTASAKNIRHARKLTIESVCQTHLSKSQANLTEMLQIQRLISTRQGHNHVNRSHNMKPALRLQLAELDTRTPLQRRCCKVHVHPHAHFSRCCIANNLVCVDQKLQHLQGPTISCWSLANKNRAIN